MAAVIIVGENSYADILDAEQYFNERLFCDEWMNADADTKAKALIMATKKIDRQPIIGKKASFDQILQFPRMIYSYERTSFQYIGLPEKTYTGPGWVAESSVSNKVKEAVFEEALAILKVGDSSRIKLQQQGVKSMSLDGMSETYTGSQRKLLSQEARELLKNYLAGSVEIC